MNTPLDERIYGQPVAEDFDPASNHKPREAYLRKIIQQHFPKQDNAHILDLGCGFGDLLICAKQAGYTNLVGADSSASRVKIAQQSGLSDISQQDALACLAATSDNSVDVLACFDIIEHLPKAELPIFTDAVLRVLRPGGRWLIHAPNGISPFGGRIRYGDLTHELAFTPAALEHWLQASGYTSIQCYEEAPAAHGAISAVRWLLWQGIRCLYKFFILVETGDRGKHVIVSQNFLTVAQKPK